MNPAKRAVHYRVATLSGSRESAAAASEPSSLLTDLIGYWKLDEASGTREDSTSNGLDLTDNNTVTQAAGKVGNAAQFTAVNNESLTHADEAAIEVGDSSFTFAAWVYWDSFPDFAVVASKGDAWYVLLNASDDRPALAMNGAIRADWGVNLSSATWYYVLAYWDKAGGKAGIQVNNGTAVEASYSTFPADNGDAFALGAFTGGVGFHHDGRIDEAGLWRRLLTSDEKTLLYGGGSGLTYPFV